MLNQTTKTSQNNSSHFMHGSSRDKELKRDFSAHTDILTFLLAEVGMPARSRPFVDALVGASLMSASKKKSGWFELKDYDLGKRLPSRNNNRHRKEDSIKKQAQRHRKPFEDWQIEAGIVLIEIEHGGEKDGVEYKTRYNVDKLLEVWAEAVRHAKQSNDWLTNPERARRKAVEAVAHKLVGTYVKCSRGNERRKDAASESIRYMKAAITSIRKSLENAKRSGLDPKHTLEKIMSDVQKEYAHFIEHSDDQHNENPYWWTT